MDFIMGLIEAIITVGAIALIVMVMAALLPMIFSLGTIMDKRINNQ